MSKTWMKVRDSFWFMPAVYSFIALLLVVLTNLIDAGLASGLKEDMLKPLLTEKDTAKKLYGTLVTAILTMTTLSFSVIMVVLTTYASQFSPRILQNFMKSKFTQHVLGIYSLGFVFALVLLYLVDHGEPILAPFVMVIIAIINLGAFVYFIHHSARFLQVNNLIDILKNAGSKVIDELYIKEQSFKRYNMWNETEVTELKRTTKDVLTAKKSGYVQNINWKRIITWASKNNGLVELHVLPGSFIPAELPIMTVWTDEEVKDDLESYVIIGNERSDLQDLEFTIQKIEEIALRAISPSTNDPHTAINCMNRMGVLLTELGEHYEQTPYLIDKQDQLRVIHHPMKYEDYLYKSFYELRHYGQNDVSVMYGILDVLHKIAVVSSPKTQHKIWQFHYYIVDVIEWDALSILDYEHLQTVYNRLEACCEE